MCILKDSSQEENQNQRDDQGQDDQSEGDQKQDDEKQQTIDLERLEVFAWMNVFKEHIDLNIVI